MPTQLCWSTPSFPSVLHTEATVFLDCKLIQVMEEQLYWGKKKFYLVQQLALAKSECLVKTAKTPANTWW